MDNHFWITKQHDGVDRLIALLHAPVLNWLLATAASAPFAADLYGHWLGGQASLGHAMLGVRIPILIVAMVSRAAPVQSMSSPLSWLLALVVTSGTLAFPAFAEPGVPLVLPMVSNLLTLVSAAALIYARLSLIRFEGAMPAWRAIATSGAHRFVRHPIYTGAIMAMLALLLQAWSPRNLAWAAAITALLLVKSVIEERKLRGEPHYDAYLRRVRWRWLPGI